MSTQLAFDIGYDHYRLGLPLDIIRFQDHYRKPLLDGRAAALMQRIGKKKPNLFDKKLLCIRDRALIKGIEVTITARDLEQKLKEAGKSCPITLRPFTFAENDVTDWSVDRIDNNKGYTPDNIVIVSRLANTAKDDLDLGEIIKRAILPDMAGELLSTSEWLRMARFYYSRLKLTKPLNLCLLLSNTSFLFDYIIVNQLFLYEQKKSRHFIEQLTKYTSKETVVKAAKLTRKRVFHKGDINLDIIYDSPKLNSWVNQFRCSIHGHSEIFNPLLLDFLFG